MKTIWFFTEFVVGFVLIYFNLAIVFSAVPVGGDEQSDGVKIYVKSNGIHTDICVPVTNEYKDWREFLPVKHFPKVKEHHYVSIGWGDKGFFLDTPTWDDLTFYTAFNAAFCRVQQPCMSSIWSQNLSFQSQPKVNLYLPKDI
ncbi:MAG: DUF2459 domain-containing protein [Crocinitomicaceae bacterium]|nr:DUF2459 domain-containing protein [Crocinitomicaceae bacterium]